MQPLIAVERVENERRCLAKDTFSQMRSRSQDRLLARAAAVNARPNFKTACERRCMSAPEPAIAFAALASRMIPRIETMLNFIAGAGTQTRGQNQ